MGTAKYHTQVFLFFRGFLDLMISPLLAVAQPNEATQVSLKKERMQPDQPDAVQGLAGWLALHDPSP